MNEIEKKELELILASPGFWRAKKLRQALTFLCEKQWAGDGEVPTQYDLAEELYGDIEPDTIIKVRNLIMRLRTKLNEFYEINGKDNGLKLEIPLGEYRAVFHSVGGERPGISGPVANDAASTNAPVSMTGDQPSSIQPDTILDTKGESTGSTSEQENSVTRPAGSSSRFDPYVMSGEETPVEYILVPDRSAGKGADPTMEGWFLRRLFGAPSGLMKLLLALASVVVIVLLIGWGITPREETEAQGAVPPESRGENASAVSGEALNLAPSRASVGDVGVETAVVEKSASRLKSAGNRLTGYTESDTVAWTRKYDGQIRVLEKLAVPSGQTERWLVGFGGRVEPFDTVDWSRPRVVIVNAAGRQLMEPVDLLAEFNPFRGKYEDELFGLTRFEPGDLDCDGYDEGIVHCYHQWYPHILYFISGAKSELAGAFANSGRMHQFVLGPKLFTGRLGKFGRSIGVLGTNNRMGYQDVFFLAGLGSFNVSPDVILEDIPDSGKPTRNDSRYRPVGKVGGRKIDFHVTEERCFHISPEDGSEPVLLDSDLWRSTDPWFETHTGSPQQTAIVKFKHLYEEVRQGKKLVRAGHVDRGEELFRSSLQTLVDIGLGHDDPWDHFIRTTALTTMKQAGYPELARGWLPANPAEAIHPGRWAFWEGELLLLLGEDGAAESFSKVYNSHDNTYLCELYAHAQILEGVSGIRILNNLGKLDPGFDVNPVCRSWLLIPGLLGGEADTAKTVAKEIVLPEPDEMDVINEYRYYPQQREIWNALADIEMGIVPIWPDEENPLIAEGSQREMVDARLQLLEAVFMHERIDPDQGLHLLSESYGHLKKISKHEPRAIIPLVYVAYKYGFAAFEAGEMEVGAEALETAIDRYPWGRLAERANARLWDWKGVSIRPAHQDLR